MKPPRSIVFFTTSAGAGYGMLALMPWFAGTAHSITAGLAALALVSLGLLSSAVHLTNPKNAWRAVRCFRTSWLSREAVFALAVYPPALVVLAGHLGWLHAAPVFAWLTALLSLITLYCTGMIYQSLRTIPSWHTPFTALRFVFQGLATGALILWWLWPDARAALAVASITLLSIALIFAMAAITHHAQQTKITLSQALGIDQRPAHLLNAGHSGSTFLTHEFGFEITPNRMRVLRFAEFALAYALPVFLVTVATPRPLTPSIALLGTLIGRWLFFAQAQHVVRLYHGQTLE